MKKKKIDVGVEIPQSPARATLLQSPGWRERQRHEQNPGYAQTTNNMSSDEERHNSASICLTSRECRP